MHTGIRRPHAACRPDAGLLRTEHFQVAYATNDMERAMALFRGRLGIREFRQLQGPTPAGGHIHVELAWVGSVMYELIAASGPGSELFVDRLPRDDFGLRHHHLGFLVHDQAEWDALMGTIERDGWRLAGENDNRGFMRHCFVDIPELGHYLEYIFPEPAGLAFLQDVPAN